MGGDCFSLAMILRNKAHPPSRINNVSENYLIFIRKRCNNNGIKYIEIIIPNKIERHRNEKKVNSTHAGFIADNKPVNMP